VLLFQEGEAVAHDTTPVIANGACDVAIQESHNESYDSWIVTPPNGGWQ
jgi:hypothetical protein